MASRRSAQQTEPPRSGRILRWTGFIDEDGQPASGFEVYPSEEWRDKWTPPCPDGCPVEARRATAYRERSSCELELRVTLASGEHGICQTIVDEREEEIYVRVLVHRDGEQHRPKVREYRDVPVRSWLDHPLDGER
jgi:hypothetical protein